MSNDKIENIRSPILSDPDAWFVSESDRIALLAERIARAEIGENHWPRHSAWFRQDVIDDWRKRIEMIRRARLDIVEREDGR